jgi:thioredoxin reductase (NADPH)
VRQSPALLFDPDRYRIRWLGAPMGEEAKIFLEALLLVGSGESSLSGPAAALVAKMNQPRTMKVFVSASCPYCPQQALNALKAAVARPDLFAVEIIDIQANAELADRYAAHSVPQTYADDVLIAKGAQPEELFLASLEK